jgi:hypothetical protein
LCIKDFEVFVGLNTYFLSPPVLHEYLFGKSFDFQSSNNVIDINFLQKIRNCQSAEQLENILRHNPIWLDILIRLTVSSYESLGRLLLLLDEKYKEKRITNKALNEKIRLCLGKGKQLPKDSQGIKNNFEKCKALISFLVSKAFFMNLSEFLRQAVSDSSDLWRYLLEEITLRFEQPMEGFKILLSASKNREEPIIRYLQELYKLVSRGEQKAFEGYGYENVLLEYFSAHGIMAEGTSSEKEKTPEDLCRNWDIYIPNKFQPRIVIECMYNVTTSSGQTNKCKAILECLPRLNKKGIRVFVLMDGAGWIARKSDAKKLIEEEKICVFTFNKSNLETITELILTES